MAELPCDPQGVCMVCNVVPPDTHVLICDSCSSPWHMHCLNPPLIEIPIGNWPCPDCCLADASASAQNASGICAHQRITQATAKGGLLTRIRAVQTDATLTDEEKAKIRQSILTEGRSMTQELGGKTNMKISSRCSAAGKSNSILDILEQTLICIFCMQLAERPVTTPCGHNFCLKCFQRWTRQGKRTCGKCRSSIPDEMASQPRINSTLVMAIRLSKAVTSKSSVKKLHQEHPESNNLKQLENRPDGSFTTDRAKKPGQSNASSGQIFVTIAPHHFGPILAENDSLRGQGVLVGECWKDRMECRQWGVHLPHVSGICGQADYGAQSVALSGGYEDDEDYGEWFLYTGSGGRDLSGNKRINKQHSFDQKFDKQNEALRVSCTHGYPVRVVRSYKEKHSSYSPESGVRYDGIYRIEKCWRKNGIQGYKVCRYLFVRCDNEPAPWTSDEHGDRPCRVPEVSELESASDITERACQPFWDWKEEEGVWGWTRSPPSPKRIKGKVRKVKKTQKSQVHVLQKLLREFGCSLCKKVLTLPLSTPCGHNFCKLCLESVFSGQLCIRERFGVGGRCLRAQKMIKNCPSCKGDITDFLHSPQINRQLEDTVQFLKNSIKSDGDSYAPLAEKELEEHLLESIIHCENSSVMQEDRAVKSYESKLQESQQALASTEKHPQDQVQGTCIPTKSAEDNCSSYSEFN